MYNNCFLLTLTSEDKFEMIMWPHKSQTGLQKIFQKQQMFTEDFIGKNLLALGSQ